MTTTSRKVYLARAGANGEDEEFALENHLAIIGFTDVPTLDAAKDYDDVLKIVEEVMPGAKPRAIGNRAGQVWAFAVAMKPGDIVVMPRKLTSQIALGIVSGPYEFRKVREQFRHTRPVKWVRPDLARTVFSQDLLYSFGAFMTVCNIARNDAERRVAAILEGKPDPGFLQQLVPQTKSSPEPIQEEEPSSTDLQQLAQDQIERHIQSRFSGHALSGLVEAVLKAEGWVTRLSPPGADGGVDILAGRGSLGLDQPRLCVQVKSQSTPVDVTVYRTLQGSMQSYKADQGLLVAWGGFNRVVLAEAKQGHFFVRLWESRDLVEAVYRNYERLPAEIQADLPLKRVWMLVPEDRDV
jgi:restriction system protein